MHLTLPRLPRSFNGFRLVQISDIHFGGWMNNERLIHVLDAVMELAPNLVAITGDFVLGRDHVQTSVREMGELESALKSLTTHFQTLAVLGNHDYLLDVQMVLAMLERSNVKTLSNSVQKMKIGDDAIYIGGVDDIRMGIPQIQQVLAKLPEGCCAIMMAPEPLSPLNARSTFIKVGEYMALGKPVVAYDLDETRYTAGDSAMYVKPGDTQEFGRVIVMLADSTKQRSRLGQIGRERFLQSLSWEHQEETLLTA